MSVPPAGDVLPAAHPRDAAVDAAAAEFLLFVGDWKFRHGLSSAEYLHVLNHTIALHLRVLGTNERAAERKKDQETAA